MGARPTGPEAAEIFTRVLGRAIAFHPISPEQQKQAMLEAGFPGPVAEDDARAVAMMAEGDCDFVTDEAAAILSRPAGSSARFVTDYAQVFSSAR